MNERSLRDHCLRVMGRDPIADGATPEEARRQLSQHLQFEGAKKRAKAGENPQLVATGYALGTLRPSGSKEA